jgi:glycosyltransferase involved in cell wall biosynthesis
LETPLVSIVLLTYNHEAYIEACLKSILDQVVNFPKEVLIGEDCSTDSTRQICEKYAKQFPAKLNLLDHAVNIGLGENLIQTLAVARGKYIAFLEGDDYWTDKNKLQKQVNLLNNRPDFVACAHNTTVVFPDKKSLLLSNPNSVYSLKDASNGRIFHTNSWMIRSEVMPDFVRYSKHLICWDILMEQKVFEQGSVYCFPESMSIWRKHSDGNSVKIPLRVQYKHFELLYKTLRKESIGKPALNKHFQKVLKNFYAIFALELARCDKHLHMAAIRKALILQIRLMKLNPTFLPQLILNYLSKKDKSIDI